MTKKPDKAKSRKLRSKDLRNALLSEFKRNQRKQLNPKQLTKRLQISNSKETVQQALDKLVEEKLISAGDGFKYQYVRQNDNNNSNNRSSSSNGRSRGGDSGGNSSREYLTGRADVTRSGSAYIVVEGREDDIFVPERRVNTAMQGDTVKVRTWTPRGRRKPEGEVMEILARANSKFVGTFTQRDSAGIVAVDGQEDMNVHVPEDKRRDATKGQKVVVSITDWTPDKAGRLTGEITAVLGEPGTSDIEMQAILINNGFDISFPDDVIAEADAIPDTISPQEIHRRRDMRGVVTFTIDPTDAKDFDDALSVQLLENGNYEVGVHIADVSHYVRPNSALDNEARQRSTSVYLVDRVCPMLPENISNVLCSLRPHEDKLTFSAVFEFDEKFRVVNRWFGRAVIHSDHRFDYQGAQQVLDDGEGTLVSELQLLHKIAGKLRKERFRTGSIDFDMDEVKFKLDENGKPIDVYIKERQDTNLLIEDFMLLANREVATYIVNKEKRLKEQIPFVYRVHDEPNEEKVEQLAAFARGMGFEMDISTPAKIAKSYNKLLSKAKEDPAVKLLAPIAIRTMSKAEYTSDNIGHYGLGFTNYTHFTSPIRRYADVLVHRVLDQNLGDGVVYKLNPAKLEETCQHISRQERRAVTAERESIKYKQVEYIMDHVGEEYDGIINGLADFGVFVELKDTFCEGMIAYENMDEPYDTSNKLAIVGQRSGKVLKMGDTVRVTILDADLKRRRVDMALVDVLHVHPTNDSYTAKEGKSKKKSGGGGGGRGRGRSGGGKGKSRSRNSRGKKKE